MKSTTTTLISTCAAWTALVAAGALLGASVEVNPSTEPAPKIKVKAGKNAGKNQTPFFQLGPQTLPVRELKTVNVQTAAENIDALISKKLGEEKIVPNAGSTDEVYVRRVYLDVIGRIPTKQEALAFLDSSDPNKRSVPVDKLLTSEGYVQNFFNFWADVLRVKSTLTNNGQAAGAAYIQWLKQTLRDNVPYDVMVRRLIASDGATYENGAVGYYMRDYNMPLDNMAITTQVFLGTQIVCAQCHNHPFDKWTQMDYYQLAAHSFGMAGNNNFANQREVSRELLKASPNPDDRKTVQKAFNEILFQLRFNHVTAYDREVKLPTDYQYTDAKPNQVIAPMIPVSFSNEGKIVREKEPPVEAYARWMTSSENSRFTKVAANRLWKKLFGMGVIDPVDELTDSTVPSNPALMEFLEQTLKDVNYDMKAYLRILLNTESYQREAYAQDVELGVPYHFPGPLLRRMSAEQIWDSMVTLANDRPDEASHLRHLETKQALTKIEWMDRALEVQTPEELIEGGKVIAAYQRDLVKGIKEKQEILKSSKNEADIRAAKELAKNQRRMIFKKVEDVVFSRGFQKLVNLASQDPGLLAKSTDKEFSVQVTSAVQKLGKQPSMQEALAHVTNQQKKAFDRWVATVREREIRDWNLTTPELRKSYQGFADNRDRLMMRAADLRNPAPNGHFLRQFGQSDREIVDNVNKDASVMQALTMMNGSLFSTLKSRYGVLGRELAKDQAPEQVLDTLYLSTLSRHATAEEKALLLPVLAEKDQNDAQGDVLWSLLNTRQFLFIQ